MGGGASHASANAYSLPRGGVVVQTKAGPVQIGIPPETIKDHLAMKKQLPSHYIIPRERFDRHLGINVAEFEFPAYYNFFVLRKRVNLITTPDVEKRIRAIFQETLFGPAEFPELADEFAACIPNDERPDLKREREYFRKNPFNPKERMEIDTVLSFTLFDENSVANIGNGVSIQYVESEDQEDYYAIFENGVEIHRAPSAVTLPQFGEKSLQLRSFDPPVFGITMLGTSHGFDAYGKCTGFIVWVNKRGIMVDPPTNAAYIVTELGVPPSIIECVILSHCHADHDAGTFQKILQESKIQVFTTPTIMNSFIRKYAATSGLDASLLRKLFIFRPVKIGQPSRLHGAEFRFFYALHSIPCIGFEVYYGGKSIAFSGDTLNDQERIWAMYREGVFAPGRRDFLLNFPWHHDVILHEAGVPPIHTPLESLQKLPPDVRKRIYIVHTDKTKIPPDTDLKVAKEGVENTIVVNAEPPVNAEAIRTLDLITAVEIFRSLSIARASLLLQIAQRSFYPSGATIVEEGMSGEWFYVIESGVVTVKAGDLVKTHTAGEFFGENSIVTGAVRTATIQAATDCCLLEFDRHDFFMLVEGTDIVSRMTRLAEVRSLRSYEVLCANPLLGLHMTGTQKTQLQTMMQQRAVKAGEELVVAGKPAESMFLLESGSLWIQGDGGALSHANRLRTKILRDVGTLVGDAASILAGGTACYSLKAQENSSVFVLSGEDVHRFLANNPGIQLMLMDKIWI
eukprot:Rmarinus@m.16527